LARPALRGRLDGRVSWRAKIGCAGDENATLDGAFNQLQTYKAQISSLFRTNAALVISDGIAARIGSLTADRERFMPWRTVTGADVAPKGTPELETVLKGVFDRSRFLAS
jgi:type I restriction enzyme, R subunit